VIWQNMSVQMNWIAEKLEMKSASNVSQPTAPVGDSGSNPNPVEGSGAMGESILSLS